MNQDTSDRISYDFTAHLTHFCRVLRSHGLLISPQDTADVMRALSAVDMMDKGRVYWSLRALLLSRRDEIPIYDSLFERFWNFEELPLRPHIDSDDDLVGGAKEFRRTPSVAMMPEDDPSSENTLVQMLRTGASSRASITPPDLRVLRADELSELSRIAARLIRAMASRPGRRRKRHRRKGSPDLRGAMRLNLSSGGDAMVLPRKRRVPRTPRLLVMLDVSGSMERHVQLLLQLIFAVSQHTKRVETFVFSTSATRVTRELSAPSFSEALVRALGGVVRHWSGGTRIGEALAHVNTRHEYVLSRYTTVFLLSDGWDTGEPERLSYEVQRMRRRVHRVVWLNPLLGSEDYQPLTRSLQAALPYIDHHASARDVESLKRLPRLLR